MSPPDSAARTHPQQVDELRKFLSTSDLQVVGSDATTITLGEYLNGNEVGAREVIAVDVTGGAVTLFVDQPEAVIRRAAGLG